MASEQPLIDYWREALAGAVALASSCLAAVKWAVPIGRRMWAAHATAEDIAREFGKDAGKKLRSVVSDLSAQVSIAQIKHALNETHLGIGVYVCGFDGRCEYANPVLCEMFGLQESEMKGWGWLRAVTEPARVHEAWKFAVQNELPYRESYTVETHGQTVDFYTEAFPVMEGDQVVKYLGVVKRKHESKTSASDTVRLRK